MTTHVSSQPMVLPLSERSNSQENSRPDERRARSTKSAHNVVTIVISDDPSGSQSSLDVQNRPEQAQLQEFDDDDDEAILSEPLFEFEQSSCFTRQTSSAGSLGVTPLEESEDFPQPSQNSLRTSRSRNMADPEALDNEQDSVVVKRELLDQSTDEDDSEDEHATGNISTDSTSKLRPVGIKAEVRDEEMDSEKHHNATRSEDEETDLDVLRFRGHLSAFVSDAVNPRKGQSSSKADSACAMAPPTGRSIAKKPRNTSPGQRAHSDSSADVKRSKSPSKSVTARTKGKVRATTQTEEELSSAVSRADAQSEPATPTTKVVRKRRPQTPPPDPIDLGDLASALFLILTSCPICGDIFPKYKSGTIRRKHVGVCAAKRELDADFIGKLVKEEIARLDKAERAKQTHEDELKAMWQLLLEERGIPIVHDKSGPVNSVVSSGARKRKLVGSAGSLLISPAESRREAAKGMLTMLEGNDLDSDSAPNGSSSSSRKRRDQGTEEPTLGLDHDTGDVISDVSEPAFAFPGDQLVAETRFLSTQFTPSQGFFPSTTNVSMYMPSPTQTFTQAPSSTIRSRSSSRLWKRRRPVPGAGTGLGVECLPLSSGMSTISDGYGEFTSEQQQEQQKRELGGW